MKGLGVSPGVAIGCAMVSVHAQSYEKADGTPALTDPKREEERFLKAVAESRRQLVELRERLKQEGKVKESAIFEAHALFLDDPEVLEPIKKKIDKGVGAEAALNNVMNRCLAVFEKMGTPAAERQAADVRDITARILNNLGGGPAEVLKKGGILVARELAPSETADLEKREVGALVTEYGGSTSHTALVAQAMDLPAVLGVANLLTHVEDGDLLVVDGTKGEIIINPSPETQAIYGEMLAEQRRERSELKALRGVKAKTKDGRDVTLLGNITIPEETKRLMEYGAEGIGLYRTEFLFMGRRELPDEEEQFASYAKAVTAAEGKPVVIRTLDLGGDKFAAAFGKSRESNPFLGWRAIRICLDRPDFFRTQLRAMIRAANLGDVRIMFPMVATVEEFRHAKSLFLEAKAELTARGEKVKEYIPCGMMVEIPAAALMADHFAKHVDFFSIGSNDLVQYTLAADRGNAKVAKLYDALHPAVLRLISLTVQAARRGERKIDVCCCGAAAGKPESGLLYLGLGVNELSMPAEAQSIMKRALARFDFEECENAARRIAEAPDFDTYKELRAEWASQFKKEREK
ncbi:phosphoenolpyruvate--protein phosphotransferase [bacterium]|nr:phosphoenolpyruvate--protein phosphotransferase [bacterium]